MKISSEEFSADYYERGEACGLSCYTDYRWMPDLTIPMVRALIRELGIKQYESILDFGCAKGYVVKAFKQLGYHAVGVDVSEYAINASDPETRPYLFLGSRVPFFNVPRDWILAKDVLEHIPEGEIPEVLKDFRLNARKLFVAVPLGNNGAYTIPEMEKDVTHRIRRPLWWWSMRLEEAGFKVRDARFEMRGVKENWTRRYKFGNGFLAAE